MVVPHSPIAGDVGLSSLPHEVTLKVVKKMKENSEKTNVE
jgi:hypothetical protein